MAFAAVLHAGNTDVGCSEDNAAVLHVQCSTHWSVNDSRQCTACDSRPFADAWRGLALHDMIAFVT